MAGECDIVEAAPALLALTEAVMPRPEIPARILGLFDIVYAWLRTAGVRQAGHNVALYDRCTPQHLRIRVGFPVSARFTDTDRVRCVDFAPGRAAHATHVGPYDRLGETHRALSDWCARQGLPTDGTSWEVYADWSDDPALLRTDVYLGLRDDPHARNDGEPPTGVTA